jgi:hypothetical protein
MPRHRWAPDQAAPEQEGLAAGVVGDLADASHTSFRLVHPVPPFDAGLTCRGLADRLLQARSAFLIKLDRLSANTNPDARGVRK